MTIEGNTPFAETRETLPNFIQDPIDLSPVEGSNMAVEKGKGARVREREGLKKKENISPFLRIIHSLPFFFSFRRLKFP